MKKHILLLVLTWLVALTALAEARRTIIVGDQSQFDQLDKNIHDALAQGVVDLTVSLQPGVYYYREKHVDLSSVNRPKVNLVVTGKNALLVGRDGQGAADWQMGCFDPQRKCGVDLWSALEQSPQEVDVVDAETKLCRIRTASRQSPLKASQCEGQYLQLTEWYDSKVYPIVRRDRRYIYFTATDLQYSEQYRHWNVNLDVAYAKANPRYRTTDAGLPPRMVACRASTFLNLWHSSLSSLTLRGIVFGPNHGAAPLIDTDMFNSRKLLVENCRFEGVRGLVLKVWHTDNVEVRRNTFDGCYANGIESFNGSRRTQVTDNTFVNHGRGMRQNFGIICRGEDFAIRGNRFRNFCYTAIGVGLWYGHQQKGPITGEVTGNDIAFDDDFYADYARHTLMDGGAIYTWTCCDHVEITGNRIDHYQGMKDYRGIFCDDGGKNITVRDNSVTRIGQGCWCIDLRWVDHVTGKVPDHNTGNDVSGNRVDGRIRFETSKPLNGR